MVAVNARSSKHGGPRKTRGRGLRTTNGCITCRKRHLKCDEIKPFCKNCSRNSKTCLYSRSNGTSAAKSSVTRAQNSNIDETNNEADAETFARNLTCQHLQPISAPAMGPVGAVTSNQRYELDFTSPNSVGTASLEQPIGVATARWFDMLAEDANISFDPLPLDDSLQAPEILSSTGYASHTDVQICQPNSSHIDETNFTPASAVTNTLAAYLQPNLNVNPWRSPESLTLKHNEQSMFATFVTHISQWIDLFDPFKHFSSLVPRLALYNVGLMNAILALSIRFCTLKCRSETEDPTYSREDALHYYRETLHYLSTAMQHTSYHTSLELLATTLIISAYEMLDGSSQDWKRHLQGVFWIQRSQVIHGDSGGLRAAVWWAWLCQDIWAAFRDKRRVFTFWKPQKSFKDLEPAQLAARSVFLFGRVVNYCVQEDSGIDLSITIASRLKAADTLLAQLDEWHSLLTPEFMPLPHCEDFLPSPYPPIWIHPPMFASSLQIHHASRILVLLNRPRLGGIDESNKLQHSLNKHVDVICGIAFTLSDYASSTMSSICLFIAGLCTVGQQRRQEIVRLLDKCRNRTGWPIKPLSEELASTWQELAGA